jgi:flagellar biosynthetic protein FliQ
MTVNATTPVTSPSTSTASSAASAATQSLSYNDFLTLLMAEMKNQDPTQPMDPSQMVSQLATVSEVGQAVQSNTTLASLLTATSLSQAEQLIGRTVTSADGSTSGEVAFGQRWQRGRGGYADQWLNRVARQRRERAMNEGDAIDLVQSAIWMVVVGAGPCVGAAMAVGIVIALLQALTQIQEMTLTFVPKMIAVFVAASLTASFVGGKFSIFTQSIYARIEQGYK